MAPQSGHPRGAQQTGRSAGPGWRDQARLCPQDVPQWPQGEYLLGGPGGCPPDVLGLHLSMGYGDPCPLLSGTRGPKSPLARLTAITWRLMASLGQLLRGQGNRRELQVLQLVGPELQKLLTKVRSFCKLTHQDRDAPPSRREQDASQAGRCGASSEGDGCYCGGSRKARRSVRGGLGLPSRCSLHSRARWHAAVATSSSGQPTCGTAGPPGCARSSRPARRRPRAAG